MNKVLFFYSILFSFSTSQSQSLTYQIDFENEKDDKLTIEVELNDLDMETMVFHFPKIIPGTYSIADYGKYVSSFQAFDRNGKKIHSKRKGLNSYLINDAKGLKSIRYEIEDTWDSGLKKNRVFEPAGTGFESKKYYFLNTGALYCYIEGHEDYPVHIVFKNVGDLYIASALEKNSVKENGFSASTYAELVDSPILISKPDTFVFHINNCKILVSSYHDGGVELSPLLRDRFILLLSGLSDFFEIMPAKEYHFLLYVKDAGNDVDKILSKPSIYNLYRFDKKYPGLGALEHNTSSTYFLLDVGDLASSNLMHQFHYTELIKSTAIHEFMHLLTPLKLRSELISNFNFQNPRMSKHLWFYEGVTEYFAGIIPLKSGQISPTEYLNKTVKQKWELSRKFPFKKMSFTEMSENVLKRKYNKQYQQVYQYGAILALCLDLEIIHLSNGEKDLRWVLLDMLKEFDENKPIPENALIDEIVDRVDPKLKRFFDSYVSGKEELFINKYLNYAGVRYFLFEKVHQPAPLVSRLNGIVSIKEKSWKSLLNGQITVNDVTEESLFRPGDKINLFEYLDQTRNEYGLNRITEGDTITLEVINADEIRKVQLTIRFGDYVKSDHFRIEELSDPNTIKVREKWWSF